MKSMHKWLAVALMVLGTSAEAATLNFAAMPGVTNVSTGNVMTFNIEVSGVNVVVRASAWSTTGSNDSFAAAKLQLWQSAGLGVCAAGETCSSGTHQADNSGDRDFILFEFDHQVELSSALIKSFSVSGLGTVDRDVSYFAATTAGSPQIAGKTVGTLGLGGQTDVECLSCANPANIMLSSKTANALFFGAQLGDNFNNDFFKIQQLSFGLAQVRVPEPAPLGLLGGGLVALALLRRRKRG